MGHSQRRRVQGVRCGWPDLGRGTSLKPNPQMPKPRSESEVPSRSGRQTRGRLLGGWLGTLCLSGSAARGHALEGRDQGGVGRGHPVPRKRLGLVGWTGRLCAVQGCDLSASGRLCAAAAGGERPPLARRWPGRESRQARSAEGAEAGRRTAASARLKPLGPRVRGAPGCCGVGCGVAAPTSGSHTWR